MGRQELVDEVGLRKGSVNRDDSSPEKVSAMKSEKRSGARADVLFDEVGLGEVHSNLMSVPVGRLHDSLCVPPRPIGALVRFIGGLPKALVEEHDRVVEGPLEVDTDGNRVEDTILGSELEDADWCSGHTGTVVGLQALGGANSDVGSEPRVVLNVELVGGVVVGIPAIENSNCFLVTLSLGSLDEAIDPGRTGELESAGAYARELLSSKDGIGVPGKSALMRGCRASNR